MKIAVVAPSRRLNPDVPAAIAPVTPAGVELIFHPQCFYTHAHFAGTDAQRAEAFIEVSNDPQYDAVWFAVGGYGACRIVDAVAQLNDVAKQKRYMGFSDAGFLLAALYKSDIGRPVHAPMPGSVLALNSTAGVERVFGYLQNGSGIDTSCGTVPSVAFNIAVLADLAATPIMPKLEGHVVMLEDVSEHLYAVDRALFNIMNAPRMRGAAGVRLGRISKVPENDVPFGEMPEEIVQRWCAKTGIPYLGKADIGHDIDNKIVPFGKLS